MAATFSTNSLSPYAHSNSPRQLFLSLIFLPLSQFPPALFLRHLATSPPLSTIALPLSLCPHSHRRTLSGEPASSLSFSSLPHCSPKFPLSFISLFSLSLKRSLHSHLVLSLSCSRMLRSLGFLSLTTAALTHSLSVLPHSLSFSLSSFIASLSLWGFFSLQCSPSSQTQQRGHPHSRALSLSRYKALALSLIRILKPEKEVISHIFYLNLRSFLLLFTSKV